MAMLGRRMQRHRQLEILLDRENMCVCVCVCVCVKRETFHNYKEHNFHMTDCLTSRLQVFG